MDGPYHYEDGFDSHWNGDGQELSGLGADVATAAPDSSSTPDWLKQISSGLTSIGQSYATIQASKQIAKTGQVPTAQVNVGVSPDAKKMLMIGGGIAAAMLGLYLLTSKRR